jgi:2-oxopent-4-enoate hydratase
MVDEVVSRLLNAEEKRVPIEPLTIKYPNMRIDDAYKIQLKLIEEREKRGEVVVGKKVGLTSKAMQELVGINEPDYGFLTDRMVVFEEFPIKFSELIQPRIEAEIAFVLKEDLKGPGILVSDVLRATDYVMPSLEIIDSRIKRGNRRIEDSIADNAGTGRVVFSGKKTSIADIDLRCVGLIFEKNGAIVSTAAGAAVLGNPVQAVAWLANKLSEFGITLYAKEIILSGSLIAAVDIKPKDSFSAKFDRLGSVKAKFVD